MNALLTNFLRRRHLLITVLALLTLSACVTQKKKGEASGLKKAYHNITGRYNGYYNANVLIQESIDKLKAQHQDNYNQILDIYPYVEGVDPKGVKKDLDEAIKKCAVDINLHRPGKWTDDCYLSIAKAQYLQHDHEAAEETLLYLAEEFSPAAMAKKKAMHKKHKRKKSKHKSSAKRKSSKKKKSKPKKKKKLSKKEMRKRYEQRKKQDQKSKSDSAVAKNSTSKKKSKKNTPELPAPKHYGPFQHKPAYWEGQLWLARNFTLRKMYDDAAYVLRRLENDPATFKSLKPQIAVAKADLFIHQKKYDEAIPALEQAVQLIRKRKKKARLYYILGQLYQKKGDEQNALMAFSKVVKYKPNYEMSFAAKMNVALNAWLSGKSTADQAIADLKKLLKDSKNKEYRDRIYYTLAQLYHKQHDDENTIASLQKSLESGNNRPQIVESALMLADIYFAKADFINAKKYYDRALSAMVKTDERYARVERYSHNLKDIAANLLVINEQDSLLAVAALPEAKQKALALEAIQARKAREAAAKAAVEAKKNNARGTRPTGFVGKAKSTFFAYDPSKVKKGKRAFRKTWGDRPLRDNWRRSAAIDESSGEEVADNADDETFSEEEIAQALKDVPQTPNAKKVAHGKIYQSMFNLGVLYRDRLEASQKSMDILEDMRQRYPDSTRLELDALYYLYLDALDLGLAAKEKKYRDLVLKKYPDSKYARVIKDPSYLKNLQAEGKEADRLFKQTFALYQAKKYKDAKAQLDKAVAKIGTNHPLMPKFALLNAFLTGALQGRKEYVASLKDVMAKYKNTEEEKRAKEILRILGEISGPAVGSVGKTHSSKKSKFKFEPKRLHYVLVSLDGDKVVVSDVKAAISDFNKVNYRLQQFRVSNIYLGSNVKNPIIVIRKLRNKDKAMDYYKTFVNDPKIQRVIKGGKVLPISQSNYRKILRQKSLDGYEEFFLENYQ